MPASDPADSLLPPSCLFSLLPSLPWYSPPTGGPQRVLGPHTHPRWEDTITPAGRTVIIVSVLQMAKPRHRQLTPYPVTQLTCGGARTEAGPAEPQSLPPVPQFPGATGQLCAPISGAPGPPGASSSGNHPSLPPSQGPAPSVFLPPSPAPRAPCRGIATPMRNSGVAGPSSDISSCLAAVWLCWAPQMLFTHKSLRIYSKVDGA